MAYTFKYGDRPLEGITVQRAIGRGGFGEVYYAVTDSGKQVALKYLRENPEIELRGISHVMNLKSPHLITIYDVRRNAAGDPFVIMEYVSGPSVRELMIAEPAGWDAQKAAFFLKGIAAGLSYLHERGIVHRDLKPANIFYDDGYVKIGDYGLSKHMSVSQHSGQTVSVGTVHYMAPEIGSGSYTRAIDVYALGVILYEMLTGRLPFSGSSMAEILMRHLRDNPDLSGVPRPFAAVIAKALAKNPEERYQDAGEMVAAVMESADISQSVDAFDVASLTQVPRQGEAAEVDQTMTSPPRRPPPVPPMDVRDVRPVQALPERMQRKLEHLQQRLEQKAAKLERKYGPPREPRPRRPRPLPAPKPAYSGSRVAQTVILLIIAVAVSVVLGLIAPLGNHGPEGVVAIAFYILGGTFGPLITHLVFLRRLMTRNPLLDRMAYASVGGIFMLLGFAVAMEGANEGELGSVILSPLVMLLLCDWGNRIEEGRMGKFSGWTAFWPAIIGLIVAGMADVDDFTPVAIGVCAAIALLTQSAAGMWPVMRPQRPGSPAGPAGRPPQMTPNAGPVAAGTAAAAEHAARHPGHPEARGPESAQPPAPPADILEAQPSFARRGSSAGLSFLGKLVLLFSLVLAFGREPMRVHADAIQEVAGPRAVAVIENRPVPPLALAGLAFGSLLLIAARRHEGGAHFLRGVLGCGLIAWGGLAAIIWAAPALRMIASSGLDCDFADPDVWGPLSTAAGPLVLGLLLLWWPSARARQTIVI